MYIQNNISLLTIGSVYIRFQTAFFKFPITGIKEAISLSYIGQLNLSSNVPNLMK